MVHVTSPLSWRSISPQPFYSDEWFPKLKEAMKYSPLNALEMVFLLGIGLEFGGGTDAQNKERLFLYLSIAAGAQDKPLDEDTGMIYWKGRRMIEAAAWDALHRHFFNHGDAFRKFAFSQKKSRDVAVALYNHSMGSFLKTLSEPAILSCLFTIFDPAHPKTNMSWWTQGQGRSEQEKRATQFFDWLLHNIWWKNGLVQDRELTSWARRQTFNWLLERHYLRVIEPEAIELWMIGTLRRYILQRRRKLARHKRRPLRAPLRVTCKAILMRYKRRHLSSRYMSRKKKKPQRAKGKHHPV